MSTSGPPAVRSRPANQTNSTNASRALKRAIKNSGLDEIEIDPDRELPHPAHRLAEVWDEFGSRLLVPLSESNEMTLRGEVTEEVITESQTEPLRPMEKSVTVTEVSERYAATWLDGIASMLAWYERARGRRGRLARGYEGDAEYAEFEIELENSWQPSYCAREIARLKAIERETVGGERPTGVEASGEYENPHSVILTLSASSKPDDERVGPADHDRAIANSWSNGVYRTLYNKLDALGVADWVYHKQGEPHPGGGLNHGYGHHHVMVLLDAAPIGAGDCTTVLENELRSVVEKHVDVCDLAGEGGHGDDAVSVRRVAGDDPWDGEDDVQSWSAYAAEYISSAEEDFLERPPAYIAWAATQWSTMSQKATRSMTANSAIAADACKQRAESDRAKQTLNHGERIVRSSRRGVEYECGCCGSPWQIPQHYETLTAARREHGTQVPVTDGAGDVDGLEEDEEDWLDKPVGERWPSATEAVERKTGVDPNWGVRTVTESVERPPSWRMDAIIESDGEERPASGGGVDMRPLMLPTLPKTRGEVAQFLNDPATYVLCECDVLARSLDPWRDGTPDECSCGCELRLANVVDDWTLGALPVEQWVALLHPDPVVRERSFAEQQELDEAFERVRTLAVNTTLDPLGVLAQAGLAPEHFESGLELIEEARA
ncbi:hypothetical protein GCM10009019_12630 [Salarchaeum japonicum]|uniref:Replication protein n=2 Tax=Salarchaeum japonicum TaxID=555573 RepID=A0AAV3T0U3_9EURY